MFKNLTVAYKLLLILSVPILAMTVFAVLYLQGNLRTYNSMKVAKGLVAISTSAGTLVHELQKERGFTSGFVASKGAKFGAQLPSQRQAVDEALKRFEAISAAGASLSPVLAAPLKAAAQEMQKLAPLRASADSMSIDAKGAIAYYTGLIARYQNIAYAVISASQDPDISMEALGYAAFQGMKEANGQLRATINRVLTVDANDLAGYQQVIRLVAAEELCRQNFVRYGAPALVAEYQTQVVSAAPVKKAEELLGGVLAKGVGSGFGIAPETWVAAITEKINTLKQLEDRLAANLTLHAERKAAGALRSLVGSAILATLFGLFTVALGMLIYAGIRKPLREVMGTLSSVAEGDFTVRCAVVSRDEFGILAHEVNQMAGRLSHALHQVARNSEEVSAAALQLHSTAEQIATSAEEVACQAGTVATASEEMSATSAEIANSCHLAADDSTRANRTATAGAQIVQKSVVVMGRIADRVQGTAKSVTALGERSEQIGAIVATIEDIADQTNLLALNAAIEAARAGEMGRGFAVVADEVRALAERTTKATREVGDMIKTIQSETGVVVRAMEEGVAEVGTGTAEVGKSGEALGEILEQVEKLANEVSQIATAAEEQTATTAEITANMQQISQVVQVAAVGSQETVQAANRLSSLSQELKSLVAQFKFQA